MYPYVNWQHKKNWYNKKILLGIVMKEKNIIKKLLNELKKNEINELFGDIIEYK